MIRIAVAALALGLLAVGPAKADPSGRYKVTLERPNGGGRETGTAIVTRTDEVYRVEWRIGGNVYSGIALGGAFNRGDLIIGPANSKDVMLTIGFHAGSVFGTSTMIEQLDGTYQGYRVTEGSNKALPERWVPIR